MPDSSSGSACCSDGYSAPFWMRVPVRRYAIYSGAILRRLPRLQSHSLAGAADPERPRCHRDSTRGSRPSVSVRQSHTRRLQGVDGHRVPSVILCTDQPRSGWLWNSFPYTGADIPLAGRCERACSLSGETRSPYCDGSRPDSLRDLALSGARLFPRSPIPGDADVRPPLPNDDLHVRSAPLGRNPLSPLRPRYSDALGAVGIHRGDLAIRDRRLWFAHRRTSVDSLDFRSAEAACRGR